MAANKEQNQRLELKSRESFLPPTLLPFPSRFCDASIFHLSESQEHVIWHACTFRRTHIFHNFRTWMELEVHSLDGIELA